MQSRRGTENRKSEEKRDGERKQQKTKIEDWFHAYTSALKTEFLKIFTVEGVFKKVRFQSPEMQSVCGQKAKTHRKGYVFKNARVRVDYAWLENDNRHRERNLGSEKDTEEQAEWRQAWKEQNKTV